MKPGHKSPLPTTTNLALRKAEISALSKQLDLQKRVADSGQIYGELSLERVERVLERVPDYQLLSPEVSMSDSGECVHLFYFHLGLIRMAFSRLLLTPVIVRKILLRWCKNAPLFYPFRADTLFFSLKFANEWLDLQKDISKGKTR